MGVKEIQDYLNNLAVKQNVAASTQNQALNALLFLYKHVLNIEIGNVDAVRARKPKRLPVVLTQEETKQVISLLFGTEKLIVSLLYGSGLRLIEGLRLRIKDLYFSSNQILVRDGKGFKDRVTILPESLISEIREHLIIVKALHNQFLQKGCGSVELPYALSKKYQNAEYEWCWQYVFPAKNISTDPRSGKKRRHHIHESMCKGLLKKLYVYQQ